MKEFEESELFVYINGDKAEIGKVKRVNNAGDGYFCYYHEGDTAANTPLGCMYKLMNNYVVKATTLGGVVESVEYKEGARDVINAVGNWLDEDTINELRERFLNESSE